MARKKTITQQQILDAAYQLVVEQGFKQFTARNIAKAMGCSTQPIYLEFESMADLKRAVVNQIKQTLDRQMAKRYTDDPLVDLGLAYIDFSVEQPVLYRAVFIEDHFGVDEMTNFIFDRVGQVVNVAPQTASLTDDQRFAAMSAVWIVATGIANLMGSGFLQMSQAQMVTALTLVIHDFMADGRLSDPDVIERLDAGVLTAVSPV